MHIYYYDIPLCMKRFKALITAPSYFDEDACEMIRSYADLRIGEFKGDELIHEVRDVDALFIRVDTIVDRRVIDSAPRLKVIASGTTGINHIDVEYARKKKVRVIYLHGQHTEPTAEHTLGLILAIARKTLGGHASVLRGEWIRGRYIGINLRSRVLGILGFGRIGRRVSRFARSIGMEVQGYDPYVSDGVFRRMHVNRVDTLHELMSTSDIVTIHAELTPETRGMIGFREIGWMKKGSYLINTARGEILNSEALICALKENRLAGAAVDVYPEEPPPEGDPLIAYAREHENLLLTPHIAGSTYDAIHEVGKYLALKVKGILMGGDADE